ncbi:MAG: PAS domain-containing protein, partial [Proteobacteria bacterium]|nr:PAS domain-containing protein [Pseudomonadota bacterium]
MTQEMNYLQKELFSEITTNKDIFNFLQEGSLDGVWYWDIENPEQEWMDEKFWTELGYDPAKKKHLSSEWQDLIFQEDLAVALENFTKHCENPDHPYDQIVRYKHNDGSTVWIRCRGVAIRDENGTPRRMLGVHNNITQLKNSEEQMLNMHQEINENLFRNAPIGMALLNEDKVTFMNPTLLSMLNYDNFREISSSEIKSFLPPKYHNLQLKRASHTKSGISNKPTEIEVYRRDGSL